jgi:competence protein ComEC
VLYKEVPFVKFTLPLVAGILLRYCTPYIPVIYLLLPIIICLVLVYKLSDDRRISIYYGLIIFIFFFAAGYSLYSIKYSKISGQELKKGEHIIRIDQVPVARDKSIKLAASIMVKNRRNKLRPDGRIMLYFQPNDSILQSPPGTILSLYLSPAEISDFDTLDRFDYQKYMLHSGYRYYSFAGLYNVSANKNHSLIHQSIIIQHKLLDKYSNSISDKRSLAIVSALTLGYKGMLDEEIRETFTDAGISHIMAVSGLHVGIILIIVNGILKVTRLRSRFVCLIIVIISIWSFALIAGMSPSVSRAALMFSFISIGKHIGRHANPVNSLLASAFIILIINPFLLLSVSFQLSYSAVLMILLFYKKVDGLFSFSGKIMRSTWSLISVSLLAQGGTLPFVFYHFRSVPLLSVFTNIFAIPLTFLIIVTGLIFLCIPSSFFFSGLLSDILTLETKLLYSIADWISSLFSSK